MGLISKLFGRARLRVMYGAGSGSSPPRFVKEAYEQETVRAIIDCIATHTAKAEAMHVVLDEHGRVKEIKRDSRYARLLNASPNPFMTGYDLKYKLISQLEAHTTAMVYIDWDGTHPAMMLPIPYRNFSIDPMEGGGYAVQFTDDTGEARHVDLEDVVLLRKFFNEGEVAGDGNEAIRNTLDMNKAADDGLMEALTISNKVRGLLKQTKAMLAPEAVKKSTEEFVQQFQDAAQNGGIVGVDAMADYMPLTVTPWAANAAQMREVRNNLLRYWRISEPVLQSNYTEGQWQAFYESVIEPRLIQMSQAFTVACFTPNERAHGNRIVFTTSTLMHTSMQTKVNILNASREIGLFTTNELREMFGYAPVEDGDKREVSLNYVNSQKQDEHQAGKEDAQDAGQEEAAGTTY